MSPRISVLCPTRCRPGSAARLAETACDTATGPFELVFYVDDDAPGSVPAELGSQAFVTVVTGPRIVMSDMWNKCLEKASADVLMLCADDVVFRTPGWDAMVLSALAGYPDRIAWVFGQDGTGIHGPGYGTHGFVHRNWTDAVGYLTPPWFSCDYADTWVNDLADRIGRKHPLPGLLTEHLHPAAGKAAWDASHAERLQRGERDNVAALWASLEYRREQDAARLRAVMEG